MHSWVFRRRAALARVYGAGARREASALPRVGRDVLVPAPSRRGGAR